MELFIPGLLCFCFGFYVMDGKLLTMGGLLMMAGICISAKRHARNVE